MDRHQIGTCRMGAEQSGMAGQAGVPLPSSIASTSGAGPSTNTHAAASISRGMQRDTMVQDPSLASIISSASGPVVDAELVKKSVTSVALSNPAFRFEDLHIDTLRKIIGHVFALEGLDRNFVWPFYRQGMLAGYIRVGHGDEAVHENVNLQLLQVNKLFNEVGSEVFYGGRTFVFSDPVLCSWWTKHIGPNFLNLRSLTVHIQSGFKVDLDVRSAIDSTYEEEWFGFFCWLEHCHLLEAIHIALCDWHGVQDIGAQREWSSRRVELDTDAKEEILQWRRKLQSKISQLRGLRYAAITDHAGSTLTSTNCDELCKLITQPKDTLPKSPDRRKLSLAEVLALLRLHEQQHRPDPVGLTSIQEEKEEEGDEGQIHRNLLEKEDEDEQRAKRALEAEVTVEGGDDKKRRRKKNKGKKQQDTTLRRSNLEPDSSTTSNVNADAGARGWDAPTPTPAPALPPAPTNNTSTSIWDFGRLPPQASKSDMTEPEQEQQHTHSSKDGHQDCMFE